MKMENIAGFFVWGFEGRTLGALESYQTVVVDVEQGYN